MFWGRYSIISYQWRNESWGSARNFEFTLQTQPPLKQKWPAFKSQVLVCLLLQLSSLIIRACSVQYGHHSDSCILVVWWVPAKRRCAKHTPDSDWVWTKRIWNNQIPREWFSYWLSIELIALWIYWVRYITAINFTWVSLPLGVATRKLKMAYVAWIDFHWTGLACRKRENEG